MFLPAARYAAAMEEYSTVITNRILTLQTALTWFINCMPKKAAVILLTKLRDLDWRIYSSGYIAKFVIEKNRMFTVNANCSHGHGLLSISSFDPYAKNPPISKVFREISLADELGSGMRNTYKYTKLYSGGIPQFIEGDIFQIIIPLDTVSIGKVGPETVQNDKTQVSG